MIIYEVNRTFLFYSIDVAIEKAKQIIRERADTNKLREEWKITQGKNLGFCVRNLDDWKKVGNINYLSVTIAQRIIE